MTRLRARLVERDEEAVNASQEMLTQLEAAHAITLHLEQERSRIESKLQGLNDRLIALVQTRRGE
jgi:hypothetical protein